MHESMTDLRKLVAETQVQRPKTDIGGIVDDFDPQTDGRERQGSINQLKTLLMFSVLLKCCKSASESSLSSLGYKNFQSKTVSKLKTVRQ